MPSGYTADIYEGKKVSGKNFIMKCARAFGATVMMKDDPLEKEIPEFQPSTYHLDSVERAKKSLVKYENMSLEEAEKLCEQQYLSEVERVNKIIKEKEELRSRYEKTLNEVKEWTPPTNEHIELKKYAIDQLEQSIKFDCNVSYYLNPVHRESPEEYLESMIKSCKKDIIYHTKEYQAEIKRIKERNKWVNDLKDSLK